jgi:Sulfatase-modifying factor enzyme 1
MMSTTTRRLFSLSAILGLSALLAAQAHAVTINTVPVGNAGNTGDTEVMTTDSTTGYGAVGYDYRIGTTEVTNAQYVDFLNAVAATDTYGLYNPSMGSDTRGGITRSGSGTIPDPYVYGVKADAGSYTYAAKPVVYVSWYDSLRFANWLHNGQTSGAQDASTTEDGAYTFSGATSVGGRNSGAIWFLTSEDEWYKAAYYNGSSYYDYPTATDTTPDNNLPSSDSGNSANFYDSGYTTGDSNYPMTDAGAYTLSASPYGTFDQGGNVWEWNEALISGSSRGLRGGSGYDFSDILLASNRILSISPPLEHGVVGFRVATVPEPGTAVLAMIGCVLMLWWSKRRK